MIKQPQRPHPPLLICLFLFFTLFFVVPGVYASTAPIQGPPYAHGVKIDLGRDYFTGYLHDSRSILSSPARWGRSHWLKVSIILASGVALYAFDDSLQSWSQKNRNNISEDISRQVTRLGDGKYLLPAIAGFYLLGRTLDDERAVRSGLLGLESFVLSGLFTQVLKYSFHRHRPSSGDPYNSWDGSSFSNNNLSFSSGHAAVAFSFATIVANEYSDTLFVGPIAYTLATLTAISRVHDNKHWASDVLIGSAIGYFTSKAIISYHTETRKETKLHINPAISADRSFKLTLQYIY